MSLNRKGTWLAAWVLVGWLAGVPASAQGLRDADPFAPAEPSHYGGGVRANEGFFFSYDALYWSVSAPKRAPFGIDTDVAVQRNVWWANDPDMTATQGTTMDTGFAQNQFVPGQRIELGHINEHSGWLFSYFLLHAVGQDHTLPGVQAYFNDREWGVNNLTHLDANMGDRILPNIQSLPVVFDYATLSLTTKVWGTEINYLVRTHPGHRGGMWEWTFGLRYIDFNEEFDVNAVGTPPASALADTNFSAYADNELFGPQLGLRWFITNDRWQLSTTGKFMAAWNAQSVRLNGVVGSDLTANNFPRPPGWPLAMTATNASYVQHVSVFSPVVELRIEGKYQLTRSITFNAGWNGMYIGNLARPSQMINYELGKTSVLGLLDGKNRDLCFLQGLGIGIEVNR